MGSNVTLYEVEVPNHPVLWTSHLEKRRGIKTVKADKYLDCQRKRFQSS